MLRDGDGGSDPRADHKDGGKRSGDHPGSLPLLFGLGLALRFFIAAACPFGGLQLARPGQILVAGTDRDVPRHRRRLLRTFSRGGLRLRAGDDRRGGGHLRVARAEDALCDVREVFVLFFISAKSVLIERFGVPVFFVTAHTGRLFFVCVLRGFHLAARRFVLQHNRGSFPKILQVYYITQTDFAQEGELREIYEL